MWVGTNFWALFEYIFRSYQSFEIGQLMANQTKNDQFWSSRNVEVNPGFRPKSSNFGSHFGLNSSEQQLIPLKKLCRPSFQWMPERKRGGHRWKQDKVDCKGQVAVYSVCPEEFMHSFSSWRKYAPVFIFQNWMRGVWPPKITSH